MSFRLKTILGIALIEATLLTILILSGLWYITNSAQREFLQRVHSTVDAFAVTAKDGVLSTDIASLESFVQEVLDYPGVRYARILDTEQRILAMAGDPALLARPFRRDDHYEQVDDGILDTSSNIEESGELFGRVEIGFSIDSLKQVTRNAQRYGIGIGVLEMILVALFSFILGGYLTRQLKGLTAASNEIAAGNLGYQLTIQGSDELAQTAKAFNTMSAQVASAYQKLKQQETFWRQIINSTLDAIIVIDHRGIIQSFNRGAELMLGYSADEMINQNISMLMLADHKLAHDGYIQHYLETGETGVIGKSREFTVRLKNGETLPIRLQVTEMDTEDDRMFIGVIHDVSEQKLYERQLKRSLEEKKTLLKEIHHRVKNNLLVVSSILEMQEEGTQNPKVLNILKESQDRVNSMALIHEKLYRSDTLADVDFTGYLDEIVDRLTIAYVTQPGQISVEKNLQAVKLNVETATPLGLVVNELVSNCFKHAFPNGRKGKVQIDCQQSEQGEISLCVSDDGKGLPADYSLAESESLGMQLVNLLAQQLDAQLSVEREPGTKICLSLHELNYQQRL
jgi:PAS domain S-box-containing protein